jgi:uncharacterized protein YbaR (Trm112 family)
MVFMERLPADLLEILACPRCKGEVFYDESRNVLICEACKVFYEIVEGIPNMIPEEAKPLELLKGENPEGEKGG